MKTRLLIFSLILVSFFGTAYAVPEPDLPYTTNQLDELCRTGQALCQPPIKDTNLIGAGGIDLDPDLSPSYAMDFAMGTFYLTILPLAAMSAIIAALFLVPYFILKRKNIPTRPYMTLILSGLLLHYSITQLIKPITHLPAILFALDKVESDVIVILFVSYLIPIVVLGIAVILLYRSSVIRKLIKR